MTYDQAFIRLRTTFQDAGIEDADIDARALLMQTGGVDRTFIFAHGDREFPGEKEAELFSLAERRAAHEPLQLILGETDFMGLTFHVRKNVLIPRPDTECLVEEAMREVQDGERVLDLCTGSGCVLLSLMKYKNGIQGVGVDINDDALELSRENGEALGISAEFLKSDMFEAVEGKFDCILSNPPYIRASEIDGLMDEVKNFDPLNALDGGEDGLTFYRRIAGEAKDYLTSEGRIFVEIGFDQGADVSRIFEEEGYKRIEVVKDYAGKERVVRCSIV